MNDIENNIVLHLELCHLRRQIKHFFSLFWRLVIILIFPQYNDCLFHNNFTFLTHIQLLIYRKSMNSLRNYQIKEIVSLPAFVQLLICLWTLKASLYWMKSLFVSFCHLYQTLLNSNPIIPYLSALFNLLLHGNFTDLLFSKWHTFLQVINEKTKADRSQIVANPHMIPLSALNVNDW